MLDEKDKKLLYQLDIDARQTDKQLGKKIGLSQQAVNYRIKRLIEKKIIRQFHAIINSASLGYNYFKVYFKLQKVNPEIEKEIIDYLKEHKNVCWFGFSDGSWDLSISLMTKTIIMFKYVLEEIYQKFEKNILSRDVLIVTEIPHFSRSFLIEEETEVEVKQFNAKNKEITIDDKDKLILKTLSKNGRLNSVELAKKLNFTPKIISYRVKKLKELGVIQGFRAWIDYSKIGIQFYKVLIRFQNLSKERKIKFLTYAKYNKNIVYLLKTIGSWDIEIEFEVKDNKQLHEALLELRNEFQDIIRNYEVLNIFHEYKLDYWPF